MRKPEWSLVQYVDRETDKARVGVEARDGVHAAPNSWPETVAALLDVWREFEGELRGLQVASLALVPGARLVAPIMYPRKVICSGANYYDHAAEMGTSEPDPDKEPFFFLKPPTTTVVGPGAEVRMPDAPDAKVDWEAELGIVIADRCRNVTVEKAFTHVAAYTNANDLSARGLFSRDGALAPPFAYDWVGHKAPDGFCPIGPGIVPSWLVPNVENLRLTLSVNGIMKQDSNTNNMIVGIARLISYASKQMTLEPGDVILTGTPAGVGMPRQEFLKAGDVMVVEIEGLGRLENRMVRV